jgi:hypothetical protein
MFFCGLQAGGTRRLRPRRLGSEGDISDDVDLLVSV